MVLSRPRRRPSGPAPLRSSQPLLPYVWLLPAFAVLLSVLIYPWIWTLTLSFVVWNPLRVQPARFAGVANYLEVLTSARFWQTFENTVLLVLMRVPLEFLIGFGLALLLNRKLKGTAIFRTICLLPMMLAPSIVGLTWKVLLHDELGVFNWVLREAGMGQVGWLSNPALSLFVITLVSVWQNAPFVMLVMLAGLQTVSAEQIEAARVDGATSTQVFRHITLPWLKTLILLVLFFRVIFALRTFDVVYALFKSGGPANAAMVFGVYLYESLRVSWELGTASAISMLLLLVTIAFSLVFVIGMIRRWEA